MILPDSEQPQGRLRVLAVLRAAGQAGVYTNELCERSQTHAAPRRAWELDNFYGYKILREKYGRNQWKWTLIGRESWAIDPAISVRDAKALKALAVACPVVPSESSVRQESLF